MYNLYQFLHTVVGVCFWDPPALLCAILIVVIALVHRHKQKKREEEFKEQLQEKIQEFRSSLENEPVAVSDGTVEAG